MQAPGPLHPSQTEQPAAAGTVMAKKGPVISPTNARTVAKAHRRHQLLCRRHLSGGRPPGRAANRSGRQGRSRCRAQRATAARPPRAQRAQRALRQQTP